MRNPGWTTILLTALSLAVIGCGGGGGGGGGSPDADPTGGGGGGGGGGADVGVIVFRSNATGAHEIYSVHPDSQLADQLTNFGTSVAEPALSHDGQQLVFTMRDGLNTVYVANADGSNPKAIGLGLRDQGFPQFSHDDVAVIFCEEASDGSWDIFSYEEYITPGSTSRVKRRLVDSSWYAFAPTVSRDGALMAFWHAGTSNQEIYVRDLVHPDGQNISRHEATDRYPSIHPDGTRIAFETSRDGRSQIYVMNVDGSDVRRVTDNVSQDRHPSWSPDGTRIAFQSHRTGDWDIWVIDADGGNLTNLTNSPDSDEREPYWGPSPQR